MKKHLFLFMIGTLLAMLSACSGGNVSPEEPTPSPVPNVGLTIPTSENLSPTFDAEGGSCSISFTANESWSATLANNRASEWCSVEPSSGGKGTHSIIIKVKASEETDNRSAVINLKAGSTTKNINVTQKQKDAIVLTSSRVDISDLGGEFEIEIKSNVKYTYSIDEEAKNWISYVGSRALGTSYLKFKAAMNESDDKREAKIKITDGTLTEIVTVYQSGAGPNIIVSQNEYIIGSEEEEVTVEVASNVEVEVQMPDVDWIQENKSRAYSTHTYHYTIAANETYDSRQAVIIYKNKENNLEEKVTVKQMQKDAIVIAEKQYIVVDKGGQLDFTVKANVDFDVTIEGNWIKQVASRGLKETSLYFDVMENTQDDAREGKIILAAGSIVQEIVVCQNGKTSFALSAQNVTVSGEGETFELTVTSNIGYKIEPNVDWIKEVKSRAVNKYVHKFEVTANPSVNEREGVIVVCNDEEVCIPVIVKQKGGRPIETGWENKTFYHRSLVVRFTADWCPYCPAMATNIAKAQQLYLDKIEAIHLHASGGLTFDKEEKITNYYGVTGYPTGILDMRTSIYSSEDIKRQMDLTEQYYPTQTGIALYSELDGNQLSIDLHVYAKAADKYTLTVMLLEDNIVGYQSDATNGASNDYVHTGVARVAVTDVLGDDCTTTKANQVVRKSYKVTIPNQYKKENMRIVAYVQRPFGNQPLIHNKMYGDYYVDNCVSCKVGGNLKLATIEGASGKGNEDIIPGEDIDF